MRKIRTWKKQEKRIVKLLYQKGLIDIKLDQLYWESYKVFKTSKRKHGRKYRKSIFLPEIHFATRDYWGETDEHSLVDSVLDGLWWENIIDDDIDWEEYNPESSFKYKGRIWFIKYLKSLPTIKKDSKINLIINNG
jgi:hypothetical protein